MLTTAFDAVRFSIYAGVFKSRFLRTVSEVSAFCEECRSRAWRYEDRSGSSLGWAPVSPHSAHLTSVRWIVVWTDNQGLLDDSYWPW